MNKILTEAVLYVLFAAMVFGIIAGVITGYNASLTPATEPSKPSIAGKVLGVAILYTIFED